MDTVLTAYLLNPKVLQLVVLLITFVSMIKFILMKSDNLQLRNKLILFILKSKWLTKILYFCDKITYQFFTHKSKNLVNIITYLAHIIGVFGFGLMLLIIRGAYIPPFPEIIFFIWGVNGIFRAIIYLGLLFRTSNLAPKPKESSKTTTGK